MTKGFFMPYVFISHATLADGAFATRLANDLQAHGVRYWKAPECINPGERWAEAIERALEACDTMVLVLTPNALQSRWVRTETDIAIELEHKGKMTFIPLDVKPCTPSLLVKNYQMVAFRASYDTGLRTLLRRLGVSSTKIKPSATNTQAGYDFYGLFGKTAGRNYFDQIFGASSQKKDKPAKSGSQTPSPKIPNTLSIYEMLDKQSKLFGLDKNAASGKKTSKAADKPASQPAQPERTKFSGILGLNPLFTPLNTNPMLDLSLKAASRGDKEKEAFNYQKAITEYTDAIALYPVFQRIFIKTDFLLGSIYYRRGECWMGVDFQNMLRRFDSKKETTTEKKTFSYGMIGGLYGLGGLGLQSEEYKKAQEDFAKAKELGYVPPKKGSAA